MTAATTRKTTYEPRKANTLTVRRLSDDCIDTLKQAAKDNNRSMEAEVRSILEDFTAEYVAHQITTTADLVAEMQRLLDGEGLAEDEELCPPRNTYDFGQRPVDLGFDDDAEDSDDRA